MKRYEVWLALIVGMVLGVAAGSFFGRDSSAGNARTVPQAKAVDSAASVTTVNETRNESAGPPANTWVRRSLANFDAAIPGQPTPGIVDAISDALRAEAPFDQARMLMLIELMRKEDFAPVLEVLRKAKTNIKELGVVSALWIKADPKAAESWAKGQEGTPHYEVIANQFLSAAQERKDDAEVQRWLEAIEKQRKSKGAAQ
jgi:hypothetical protein